jgi:hypothetical protein
MAIGGQGFFDKRLILNRFFDEEEEKEEEEDRKRAGRHVFGI